ncbi:MAG: calcium-translocating P-type ATPase, PMCA-type [Clostridia bacterium]|nr:calcium-translocating P-type ATPase, PMCA-type [Clostridia bacterium]
MAENYALQYAVGRRNDCKKALGASSLGLCSDDVQVYREKYGSNELSRQKRPGVVRQFLHNCNDPIIRILIGAFVLNIVFMFPDVNWYETAGIAFAVFISAFVSTVSEYSSNKAFIKLYEKVADTVYTVRRDGMLVQVPVGELVVMDIVCLSSGEIVPVDGILVSGEIRVDESSLTGESRTVEKSALPMDFSMISPAHLPAISPTDKNAVFRGSAVCSGDCQILVVRVGDGTMYGALASELQGTDMPSPLKAKLTSLAHTISKIGYASAVFVAAAHLFKVFWLDAGMQWALAYERICDLPFLWSECLQAFTKAISVIVVAVPEGLPMMITVVLSSNMKKMMKNGVLVRKLIGIETSGNLSILFTDKTGTITTGELSLAQIYTPDRVITSPEALNTCPDFRKKLTECAAACSSLTSPNTTEIAINRFLGLQNLSAYKIPAEKLPFDSARKYGAARVSEDNRDILYIRGAPEYLLPFCTFWLGENGIRKILDSSVLRKIQFDLDQAAAKEYRIVLQAEGDGKAYDRLVHNGLSGLELTLTGIFFLQDEIRAEVPEAIRDCRDAGIQVIMLTGDNPKTAASIAEKCGLLRGNWKFFSASPECAKGEQLVLNGADLLCLTDAELASLLPDIRVISRVTPTDKSRLVRVAQSVGHIVGMTGDGINDAPALKAADVGFAMGGGTEVSKSASDIVITDNNFSSIRKAVLFGRTIFHSIRKFIVFQLIMNLSAVGVSLLGPLCGVENPVTVIQMLWINIIMDTLGSLAFAGEAPLGEYMKQMPVRRSEPIITGRQIRQILISAAYTIALCVVFLRSSAARIYFGRGNELYFLTAFFALFVFCGICNAFTVRTSRINLFAHLRKNKAFLLIMPSVAFIQLLIVYFGGSVFRTVPVSGGALLFCLLCALTVLPVDAVRKLLFRDK